MNAVSAEDDAIRVLHVDDKYRWSKLVQKYLEKIDDDITVRGEQNPETALDRLAAESIDCVISDYEMPRLDGIEFLRRVRSDYPNLPFVLFTGGGSEELASEATTAGATAYVKKGGPDVYQLLANQVKRSVAHRRSERRAQVANDQYLTKHRQLA